MVALLLSKSPVFTGLNQNCPELSKVVRVKYYNIFYNTKQIEGHRQDPVKREQMKIDNQKQLEQVLRERDERLKARANKVSS